MIPLVSPSTPDSSPLSPGLSETQELESQYRRDLGSAHVLTPNEVTVLAQCIERGRIAAAKPKQPDQQRLIEAGRQAKQRLVEHNLRLVMRIALRYKGFKIDVMDLVQEGNLGLMHAVDKYDHRKGYTFSTYAIWWIRQAISRALIEQAQMIRVPLYKMEEMKRLQRVRRRLVQEFEQEPTLEELATQMEMSVAQVADLFLMIQARDPLSLDVNRQVGEDEIPLSEMLEDDQSQPPEQIVITQTLEVLIRKLLNDLTPRERGVIRLRYGLADGHEHTLAETGQKLDLSHEAVRQIEYRALKKLHYLSLQRKLDEYL